MASCGLVTVAGDKIWPLTFSIFSRATLQPPPPPPPTPRLRCNQLIRPWLDPNQRASIKAELRDRFPHMSVEATLLCFPLRPGMRWPESAVDWMLQPDSRTFLLAWNNDDDHLLVFLLLLQYSLPRWRRVWNKQREKEARRWKRMGWGEGGGGGETAALPYPFS